MKTFEYTVEELVSASQKSESLFSCSAGGEGCTVVVGPKKDLKEILVVNQFGEPFLSEPLEVEIDIDGGTHVVVSDGTGLIRCPEYLFANSVSLTFPKKSIDTLRGQFDNHAEKSKGDVLGADDSTSIVYISETLSKHPVMINPDIELQHRIVVRPFIVMARMCGMNFDSNKCFLLPSALPAIKNMYNLYNDYPSSKLLLVGHTDTTGEASYNDVLSLERADSVAAFLKDDVDNWFKWYDASVSVKKRWGTTEDSHMLAAVALRADSSGGAFTVKSFQLWHNSQIQSTGDTSLPLTENGTLDIPTRKALIMRYMEEDKTTLPTDIEVTTHGCGENFPIDTTEKELDNAPKNNKEDLTDRRVELFFFDAKAGIDPSPPGSNSLAGSTEYRKWREMARVITIGTTTSNTLTVTLQDELGNPVPIGTAYRIYAGDAVRSGTIAIAGQIMETGLLLDNVSDVKVLWGETIAWKYEYSATEKGE